MAKTETVATQYGETTIEVVDCDSCGTTIAKDDASEFTLGDRDGWACQHCVDDGPLSFPEKIEKWALPYDTTHEGSKVGLGFFLSMAVFMLPVGTVIGFKQHHSDFMQGYATASVTYIVYILFFVGLWYIL